MSKAFWVTFKIVEGLSVDDNNAVLDEFNEVLYGRGCSGDGGIYPDWSWRELVHIGEDIGDIKEDDRQAVIEFFSGNDRIVDYIVGELIEWDDDAYAESMEVVKNSLRQVVLSRMKELDSEAGPVTDSG
ncbi:MAG TPA: hypothetical protein VLA34_07080 [Candidatus Krumholzibacterium sp.]|nr:hypothetical protein [Candidatus Krumholzibacterium sp.]